MSEKTKVFIVDDEEAIREVTSAVLESHGFEVLSFGAPMDLVDQFEALSMDDQDVILCDLNMPMMTGVDLYTRLKECRGSVPHFILLTGFPDKASMTAAVRVGVEKVILKPVTGQELTMAIKGLLAASNAA